MAIARSSARFAIGTVLSRVTGLARDAAVVGAFGASATLDAFLVAFRIPNLFRDMLAEGALSGAFTKVYTDTATHSEEEARKLFFSMLKIALTFGFAFSALGIIGAPWLVDLMTLLRQTAADDTTFIEQCETLTRIIFPFIIFPIIGSIAMGALHYHNRFFVSALSPVGLNLGFILGATVFAYLAPEWLNSWTFLGTTPKPIVGLAVGVLLGGSLQLAIQLYGLREFIFSPPWRLNLKLTWSPELTRVITIMIPAAIAAGIGPINVVINTNFATSLQSGAVTWLNYSFRLLQLPVGVFSVAIASAALPAMARSIAKCGNKLDKNASQQLQSSLVLALWLLIPSMSFLCINSQALTDLFFRHANFDAVAAENTALTLFAYSFGVIGYGLVKVLTSFYFAAERTRYAMYVTLSAVIVNISGNIVLVPHFGHIGIAATTALSLSWNAIWLLLGTRKNQPLWDVRSALRHLLGLAAALGVLSLAQSLCTNASLILNLAGSLGIKGGALLKLAVAAIAIGITLVPIASWSWGIAPIRLLTIVKRRGRA